MNRLNSKVLSINRYTRPEEIYSFVDRYVPGYLFFLETIQDRDPSLPPANWTNNGLCILIGQNREYLGSENF